MIPLEVPINLGRDEAQRQVAGELAKPEYFDTQSVVNDLWNRLFDWLTGGPGGDNATLSPVPTTVAVIVVVALVALLIFGGRLRHEHRLAAATDMFAGVDATADELRAEAERLGDTGQWTQATIQRFRALVRSLSERGIIEESAGMTAHEAATAAGRRLPGFAAGMDGAAHVFDGLAYGTRTGTRQQYDQLVALDDHLRRARPVIAERVDEEAPPAPGTRVTTDEPAPDAVGAGGRP